MRYGTCVCAIRYMRDGICARWALHMWYMLMCYGYTVMRYDFFRSRCLKYPGPRRHTLTSDDTHHATRPLVHRAQRASRWYVSHTQTRPRQLTDRIGRPPRDGLLLRYRLGRSRRPLPRAGGRATARAARARTDGASTAARRLVAADAPLRRAPLHTARRPHAQRIEPTSLEPPKTSRAAASRRLGARCAAA